MERELFCLIVKLEDGKLPNGYYINDNTGEGCRWNLKYFLMKHNINHNTKAMDTLKKLSSENKELHYIKKVFECYKTVLLSCLSEIKKIETKI